VGKCGEGREVEVSEMGRREGRVTRAKRERESLKNSDLWDSTET